uniref:Cytochrome c biogenesis protein Ccs1 n=1 Tax=Dictyopteris divaricata TaxID=156996 RepID=A0A2I4Q2C4_9PHAE|nr:cytochrome c biogenesis protein [Dictyopteris divaricata]YP_010205273.1 cytochrome c biogenesis protein [Grateloupia livida]AQZ24984.1 cytochrome c biogenesis protein [Dictyopteris divaricata]UAV85842.1 cytochrome c biogenesis protein [Grateloupia livida]
MFKKFYIYLANLKLAIIILLIIAFFSSIGSFIEQNKDIDFYKDQYPNQIFNIPFWEIIKYLGLDTIYTTWWFLSLLILLGFSLISCTFLQQLPNLKFSRRYYFYKQKKQFKKLAFNFNPRKVFKSHLSHSLLIKEYSIFYQKNCIYAYKGLISRVGPIVVHLSLISILLGSTLSAIQGFNSQELVVKTELFHIQNIVKSGFFSKIPQTTFRVNDFWSTSTLIGETKQFYSDISILDGQANELKRKTISVNNPLLFKNLTIYQTDWGISGIRVRLKKQNEVIANKNVQIPVVKLNTSSKKIWLSSLPPYKERSNDFILLINNNRGQLTLFNNNGQFLKTMNLGESNDIINGIYFNILDIISSTGVQIKSDPGVNILYSGFLFLIFSSITSYLSFSEFWLLDGYHYTITGAKTNRSKILLNLEFLKFKQSFIE